MEKRICESILSIATQAVSETKKSRFLTFDAEYRKFRPNISIYRLYKQLIQAMNSTVCMFYHALSSMLLLRQHSLIHSSRGAREQSRKGGIFRHNRTI
jgi:hypothetical protein